jgi:hypothetical protein
MNYERKSESRGVVSRVDYAQGGAKVGIAKGKRDGVSSASQCNQAIHPLSEKGTRLEERNAGSAKKSRGRTVERLSG